ncbi:hypothetical protein S7711_09104 [Stachybotrys chartarum IBT 7711]|uniref:Uncharacterized protein n=1 Tax=Stachybotrys chartarum (strain CBS 109288 / IBT 7711) TaxID=1280523 RepID=A0A084ASB4_STACB|nr:hypothetical protein S7711_09104 [Stachybotrys chartarum IBT 7711]
MPGAEDENERLAHADYWDERYAQTGGDEQVHEWFRSFNDLSEFFARHLLQTRGPETAPRILHLGSGDSTVPQDLAAIGYGNQLCADFSAVVVENMSKRHSDLGLSDSIRWEKMDVRRMDTIPDASIDVAFDKGTLDAMIHGSPWNPPEDTVRNSGEYLREVSRVLKPDGVFLYVTFRQPHFVKPLLECEGTNWDISIEHLGASDGSFGYSGIPVTFCHGQALCKTRHAATSFDGSIMDVHEFLPAAVPDHDGFAGGSVDIFRGFITTFSELSGAQVFASWWYIALEHPYPAKVEDVFATVQWTQQTTSQFDIDPARIVIGMQSTSAIVAAGAALLARDRGLEPAIAA